MTGPHDPEEPHGDEEEPWYGVGDDESTTSGVAAGPPAGGPTDPPTQPGTAHPGPAHPPTLQQPDVYPTPAAASSEAPRQSWWRSRRVRVGAAATLVGLVLLGGGFGAGFAVADASAPPAAAHATAARDAAKGQAARKRRLAAQHRQPAPSSTGTTPGAVAVPTF